MSEQIYLEKSLSAAVYPPLKRALGVVDTTLPMVAVDAGCGAGRDALFMVDTAIQCMPMIKAMQR